MFCYLVSLRYAKILLRPWPVFVRNVTMQWETLSHIPYHVTLIAAQKKPLDDASAELADSTYDAALQSPKREEVREEGIRHAILPNGRPTHPSIHPSVHPSIHPSIMSSLEPMKEPKNHTLNARNEVDRK